MLLSSFAFVGLVTTFFGWLQFIKGFGQSGVVTNMSAEIGYETQEFAQCTHSSWCSFLKGFHSYNVGWVHCEAICWHYSTQVTNTRLNSSHFFGFNLIPYSCKRLSTLLVLFTCSENVLLYTRISSRYGIHISSWRSSRWDIIKVWDTYFIMEVLQVFLHVPLVKSRCIF